MRGSKRKNASDGGDHERRANLPDLIVLATIAALTPLSLAAAALHIFTPHAVKQLNVVLGIIVFTAAAGLVVTLFVIVTKRT